MSSQRAEVRLGTERAERIDHDLLGPGASARTTWEGTRLVRVEATHEAGLKVHSAHARAQVESTLEQVLPGLWSARWDQPNDRVTFRASPS